MPRAGGGAPPQPFSGVRPANLGPADTEAVETEELLPHFAGRAVVAVRPTPEYAARGHLPSQSTCPWESVRQGTRAASAREIVAVRRLAAHVSHDGPPNGSWSGRLPACLSSPAPRDGSATTGLPTLPMCGLRPYGPSTTHAIINV